MVIDKIRAQLARRYRADGGYREIIKLAIPLILSSGSWALMHFIDRMLLSWSSPSNLAASGPAGILNYTMCCIFIGTVSFVSAFTAQFDGARQREESGNMLWQAIYFGAISGFVLLILSFVFSEQIFSIVNHDKDIQWREVAYFKALAPGMPASILMAALSGFLSGIGRTWPVLIVNIIVNSLNLLFDYMLIFGHGGFPEMGITGAGVATSVSGWIGVVVFALFAFNKKIDATYHTFRSRAFSSEKMVRLLKFGIPSGMTLFIDIMGFTMFFFIMGKKGLIPLAATNMAFNVNSLAFMPMVGMGSAITVLTGKFVGAKRHDLAVRTVYSSCHMAFSYLFIVALAYFFLPSLFIKPFAAGSDPATFSSVSELTALLLKFVAFYSLFDALNIAFGSALRGAGDTRFVTLMIAILSTIILIIPCMIILVYLGKNPIWGWVILTFYCCALAISFYLRFRFGPWRKFSLINKIKH